MMKCALVCLLALTMFGCRSSSTAAPTDTGTDAALATASSKALDAALAHPGRTDAERARDVYRHPKETLEFFELQPDDEVLELWAGRGWYTHILAPYLAGAGKLHVVTFAPDAEVPFLRELAKASIDYAAAQDFGEALSIIPIDPSALDFGLQDQVDAVVTFRNIHNWVASGYDKAVYEQSFRALKPGGVFGVVEHRGPAGMTRAQSSETGYMDQAAVIADIEAVGFVFVGSSEINANAKDTKDHPEGVWTLPPALRLGEVDQDKYTAIGESDRMTLKFIKPKQ